VDREGRRVVLLTPQVTLQSFQANLRHGFVGLQSLKVNLSTPLDQPQGLEIDNGNSGQLVASVKPVKNANMYEGRIKASDGDWQPGVFSGDSRRIAFNALTPGKTYTAPVRALGGSTGQSDWSDPSSHMSM
jgi:hypothetical protein